MSSLRCLFGLHTWTSDRPVPAPLSPAAGAPIAPTAWPSASWKENCRACGRERTRWDEPARVGSRDLSGSAGGRSGGGWSGGGWGGWGGGGGSCGGGDGGGGGGGGGGGDGGGGGC